MMRGQPAQRNGRGMQAQEIVFQAPNAGMIRNRNLALPKQMGQAQGAAVLTNWFPTATGVVLRRGSKSYAELGDGTKPVVTMFKYVVGNNRKLFASTEDTVYDISTVTQAYNYSIGLEDEWTMALEADPSSDTIGVDSTYGLEVLTGQTSGNWSTVQFSTTGGTFLVGVNGSDTGFYYDGTDFKLAEGDPDPLYPGITFPAGTGLTTADLDYVWAYKNRLWFLQKNSMVAWYLPVDSIGGALAPFDLGSELPRGGSLFIGQNWSLQSGGSGGLSDQCVFLSTEGEVVVYQGSNPADANDWSKVGLYRIGEPLGRKGLIRAGGDLVIATNIGFVPLSQAINLDFAALSPGSVSYPIETSWNEALEKRGQENWSAVLWPEQQMVVVAPPTETTRSIFVANARTGAWAEFTNWDITCMETFNGRLLFGTNEGRIKDAMVGGSDDGVLYTGSCIPLFTDDGTPTRLKAARMVRAETRSRVRIKEKVSCVFDFNRSLPSPPDVSPVPIGNEWNNAIWNQSVWDSESPTVIERRRHSANGQGYRISAALQVTSGGEVPLDVELVSLVATYEFGTSFT